MTWGAEYLTSFELDALLLSLFRECVHSGSSSSQLAQTSLCTQPAHRLSKTLQEESRQPPHEGDGSLS